MASDPSSPLDGVRVVDLTRYLPGPFCTLQLAFLGAKVTVVERPPLGDPMRGVPPVGGDGVGIAFASLARGKEHLLRDLADPDDRADVVERCLSADVVVESFRPGVVERLGVGPVALRARRPALVYCSISGYGQTSAWRNRPGHDANFLSMTGLLGDADAPTLPQVPHADYMGGALAATAICAALVQRERTGDGAHIDMSMTKAALQLRTMPPGWDVLRGELACYRLYRCADGRHVCVAAIEPQFWANVCRLLGLGDDAIASQYQRDAQAGLIAQAEAAFARRDGEEWLRLLEAEETCCTLVRLDDEVAAPGDPYRWL